jgi:catechol 2,3-dioxygenase
VSISDSTGEVQSEKRLHPQTEVGMVTLKVADLRRSLAFYGDQIGLRVLDRGADKVTLGAGSRPVVALEEIPGARPQPARTTGLYHSAILFPDRRSLGIKIAQLAAAGIPVGQGDHLVSEAFYLSDPDGNGLELYRDRPRSEWQWDGDTVRMATDSVDVEGMFAEIGDLDGAMTDKSAADGTKLGHMHLRVSDIALAEKFYVETLGFDVTARGPGALFVSAGGYHHHLGLNTWQSRGAPPAPEDSAGLREFSLVLPDTSEIERAAARMGTAGFVVERDQEGVLLRDPFENRIRLTVRVARDG